MSHKVFVDPEMSCVYTWLYDVVTDDDLAGVNADIRNSGVFHPHFDELVDLSLASSFPVSSNTLAQTGRECRSLFVASARRAIVAPTDVAYGISRMFQAYAEHEPGYSVHVVRTIVEACSWLTLAERARPLLEFPSQRPLDKVVGFASKVSISARLRDVTRELRQIQEFLIAEENVDPRILTDFRDALNRVRNTAWAFEQYLQSKTTETESNTVLSIVSGERVRVTYQLCKLVTADLANREIPFKKGQLIQLRDATQELGTHLDNAVGE